MALLLIRVCMHVDLHRECQQVASVGCAAASRFGHLARHPAASQMRVLPRHASEGGPTRPDKGEIAENPVAQSYPRGIIARLRVPIQKLPDFPGQGIPRGQKATLQRAPCMGWLFPLFCSCGKASPAVVGVRFRISENCVDL